MVSRQKSTAIGAKRSEAFPEVRTKNRHRNSGKRENIMPYKCGKCFNTERFYRVIVLRYEIDAEGNVLRDITNEFRDDPEEGVHCLDCGSINAVHFEKPAESEKTR